MASRQAARGSGMALSEDRHEHEQGLFITEQCKESTQDSRRKCSDSFWSQGLSTGQPVSATRNQKAATFTTDLLDLNAPRSCAHTQSHKEQRPALTSVALSCGC